MANLVRVFYPQFDVDGEPTEHDSYGEPVKEPRERLRGCPHEVPCLGFKCISSRHRGPRLTPWCCGVDDGKEMEARGYDLKVEDVGRCDECAPATNVAEGA